MWRNTCRNVDWCPWLGILIITVSSTYDVRSVNVVRRALTMLLCRLYSKQISLLLRSEFWVLSPCCKKGELVGQAGVIEDHVTCDSCATAYQSLLTPDPQLPVQGDLHGAQIVEGVPVRPYMASVGARHRLIAHREREDANIEFLVELGIQATSSHNSWHFHTSAMSLFALF